MARKPNYDQDKRRKELERKARKDAKLADRQARRNERQDDAAATSDDIPSEESATQ